MTTKSLEYFLVVVKHLNISKAAKELFISQPALSKQISQLEAELGVSLFDRTKHSLKLTHAGEVLLSETNELFKKQDELRQRVRAAGNVSEDALRLCHMPGALNYHVADILAQFQEKYPEIRLNRKPSKSDFFKFTEWKNRCRIYSGNDDYMSGAFENADIT